MKDYDATVHLCKFINKYPLDKYFQSGSGLGKKLLLIAESPAKNGWRKSGKACYTTDGKLLPTGRNINKLLQYLDLSVETCGFTEIVKCYIGHNRKLLAECGRKCWPILKKQIFANTDIRLLITLGLETLKIVNTQLQTNFQIGKLDKVILDKKQFAILPLYHPSPISPYNHPRNQEIFNKLSDELTGIISKQC